MTARLCRDSSGPVTEGEMTAGVSAEVEAVGLWEVVRTPVRRTDCGQHPFTSRDHDVADGHVLGGKSVVRMVDRAGESEQLLHGSREP